MNPAIFVIAGFFYNDCPYFDFNNRFWLKSILIFISAAEIVLSRINYIH